MPPVFVELLIKGMENNGNDMGHDDEPIQILPPDSLQKAIKKMYCDDIEMDYF